MVEYNDKLSEFEDDIKGIIEKGEPITQNLSTLNGFQREKTTSEKLGDITKKKLSKEMGLFTQKPRKKSVNVQSTREKQTVYEMFKERKSVILGLTKEETLAEFLNKSLQEVFQLTQEERKNEWKKFKRRCKALREDEMIGVISEQVSVGSVLRDVEGGHLGERPLIKKQYVYFRCFELNDATGFRKKMDKIIVGVDEAGTQIVKMSEEHQTNEQAIQVMNGGQK